MTGVQTCALPICLREMGWIQDDGATLVNLGATETFTYDHGALIAMVCLIGIAVMMARGINGAIIIGIGVASVWGWATGAYDPYNDYMAGGAGFGSAYAEWPSAAVGRSEERRVGKECRSRWSPDH